MEPFSDPSAEGYYSALYKNSILKKIVLVHRSTNFKVKEVIKSLFTSNTSIGTDIKGVLLGKETEQEIKAKETTRKIVNDFRTSRNKCDKLEYEGYTLVFTGHSLGGWLSIICAYYCKTTLRFTQFETVTFDNPGADLRVKNIQSKLHESKLNNSAKYELNLTTYFSLPNIINSCGRHLLQDNSVFMLAPTCISNELYEYTTANSQDSTLLESKTINFTFFESHKIKHILQDFNFNGDPIKIYDVRSWPSIQLEKTHCQCLPDCTLINCCKAVVDKADKTVVFQQIISHIITQLKSGLTDIELQNKKKNKLAKIKKAKRLAIFNEQFHIILKQQKADCN